jgi:hypothetical protein
MNEMKTGDQIYIIHGDGIDLYPMIYISKEKDNYIRTIQSLTKENLTEEELISIDEFSDILFYYHKRSDVAFTKAEAKKKLQKLFDQLIQRLGEL